MMTGDALTTVEEWAGVVCKHRLLLDGSTDSGECVYRTNGQTFAPDSGPKLHMLTGAGMEAVGITEGEFTAMVTSGSTALGLLLGELVAQMEWRGSLCLGIEL